MSLIFVGIQIKKNTISNQANTLQNSVSDDIQLLLSLGETVEKGKTLSAYMFQEDDLTENQKSQGRWLFAAVVRHWENVYLQYLSGTLSKDGWSAREEVIKGLICSPGWDEYITSFMGSYMSGPFMNYVINVRATSKGDGVT